MDERTCTEEGCDKPWVAKELCRLHYQRKWKTGTTAQAESRAPQEKFLAYVTKTDACWMWTGRVEPSGYGRTRYLGRKMGAHRAAYMLFVGPIPDGLTLDHLCHTEEANCAGGPACLHRRCVNPAHLEPVGGRENVMRGRTPAAVNAAKTHCVRRHEFTPENTYVYSDGRRACRACQRVPQGSAS